MNGYLDESINLSGNINQNINIIGSFSNSNQLKGVIQSNSMLQGEINSESIKLSGNLKIDNMTGALTLGIGTNTTYGGEYEITPKSSTQTLNTNNKVLVENVKVKEIPYYETVNEYGKTIYIG